MCTKGGEILTVPIGAVYTPFLYPGGNKSGFLTSLRLPSVLN